MYGYQECDSIESEVVLSCLELSAPFPMANEINEQYSSC